MDEPTIGLDIISQQKVRDFLKVLNKEEKTTIILTSHYMKDIEKLCNKLMIINKGNIIYDGNVEQVKNTYSDSMGIEETVAKILLSKDPKDFATNEESVR